MKTLYEEIKQSIIQLFGEQLIFNKEFDKYFLKLEENMINDFYDWLVKCEEGEALGSVPPRKQHKDLFVFFRKIGNSTRAILIKEQNSSFIQLILTNHNSYDNKRKELGYKKSSYYKS